MIGRNAGVREDKRIVFRIGINVGDIIIDGDDIFGDGVKSPPAWKLSANRAACASRAQRTTRSGTSCRLPSPI